MALTPLGALARGVAAGVAGTAAMTAYQQLVSRVAREGRDSGAGPDLSWDNAPTPAKVGKRIVEGLFEREVPEHSIPLVTNVVHWSYGTAWGGAYGLIEGTFRLPALAAGLSFGVAVWAMSYAQLVPMGLYKPPWEYDPKTIATDLSYHLVYGSAVAGAYNALERL